MVEVKYGGKAILTQIETVSTNTFNTAKKMFKTGKYIVSMYNETFEMFTPHFEIYVYEITTRKFMKFFTIPQMRKRIDISIYGLNNTTINVYQNLYFPKALELAEEIEKEIKSNRFIKNKKVEVVIQY